MFKHKTVSEILALSALLVFTACSARITDTGDRPASASVPPSGGTVKTPGGTAITIPSGAVDSAVTIGIAPADASPSGVTKLSQAYRFTPAGQVFEKPVTVQIKVSTATKSTPLLFWSKLGDESAFETITGVLSNGVFTAQVNHFSVGVVGESDTAPSISGIFPDSGSNNGVISISELRGTNFQAGAVVKLTRQGEADISGQNVTITGGNLLSCTFDLNGMTPGLWNIVINNPDGGSATIPYGFSITHPHPFISFVTPAWWNNNSVLGNFHIYGSGFREGAKVRLFKSDQQEVIATGVTVNGNDIECSLDLAGKAGGVWDVVVQNDDTQADVLPAGFTVIGPPPTISSITPDNALNGSKVDFELRGTYFQTGATVKLVRGREESIAIDPSASRDGTSILGRFDLTGATPGRFNIRVINPDGQSAEFSSFLVINEAPELDSVSPDRALTDTSPTISAYGRHFMGGMTFVLTSPAFSVGCGEAVIYNPTVPKETITCPRLDLRNVPVGAYDLVVTDEFGQESRLTGAFTVQYPAITLSSITPDRAPHTGDTQVYAELLGTNFYAGAGVKLVKAGEQDIVGTDIRVRNSSRVTCWFDIAGKALGKWDVVITNNDTQSATLTNGFTVLEAAPTVSSITPNSAPNNGAVAITNLLGSNFQDGATVSLEDAHGAVIAATDVVRLGPGTITCNFDLTGATTGSWSVRVANPDGLQAILPWAFTVRHPPPTVFSASPDYGKDDETAKSVTFTGAHFRAGATAKLAKAGQPDILASNVTVLNDTTITCTLNLEDASNGGWDVVVTNSDQQSSSLPAGFTVVEAPRWRLLGETGANNDDQDISFGVYGGVPYMGYVYVTQQFHNVAVIKRYVGQAWETVGDVG
ncbi:MAG: hypothetical protein WC889_18335, partial [Myxococcota bacterium]